MYARIDYLEDFNEVFETSFALNDIDKISEWNEIVKDLFPVKLITIRPESIFWFDKTGNWYFELRNNGSFWCSHRFVWSIFSTKYNMDYSEIQSFIKTQVEEDFKMENVTPPTYHKGFQHRVEEGFKMENVTLRLACGRGWGRLEESFKMENVTPRRLQTPICEEVENSFKEDYIKPYSSEEVSIKPIETAFNKEHNI